MAAVAVGGVGSCGRVAACGVVGREGVLVGLLEEGGEGEGVVGGGVREEGGGESGGWAAVAGEGGGRHVVVGVVVEAGCVDGVVDRGFVVVFLDEVSLVLGMDRGLNRMF